MTRGLGLTIGALVSLLMWVFLIWGIFKCAHG